MNAGIRSVIVVLYAVMLAAQPQATFDQHLDAARKAEAAGDYAGAERGYQSALATRKDAEILQRLGLVRHLQNKFSEAIPAFEESIRLRPDSWGALLFLGIDYYRTNQFSKALPPLTEALRLQPKQPEIRFWIGATHLASNRRLEGLEELEELSREQPRNLEALRMLAQAYSDFAVSLHNEVVEKHADSAWAHQIHGQALENEGAFDAALKEYRAALKLNPELDAAVEAIARIERATRAR
jgi:tetratricopeptide (TPR) repeat protein